MITEFKFNKWDYLPNGQGVVYFSILTDLYVVAKSNESYRQDFIFEVEILNFMGQLLRKYQVYPNVNDRLILNLTPVLKDYLVETQKIQINDSMVFRNYAYFIVNIKEYYNNQLQDSLSMIIAIFNAKPRNINEELEFTYELESLFSKIFLTKQNFAKVNLTRDTPIFLPAIFRTMTHLRELSNYNVTITLQSDVYTPQTYVYKSNYTPFSVVETEQLNLTKLIFDNFATYYIFNAKEIVVTAINTVHEPPLVHNITFLVDKCNKLIPICWLNEFGVYETFHFFDYTRETDTKHVEYKKIQLYYDGDNHIKGGNTIVSSHQIEQMTLWSDWLEEETAEYLQKSILQSKEVYLLSRNIYRNEYEYERIKPVAVKTKHQRREYTDLINISLTFEVNNYDNV